jgi:eukaryotic-like serine/threonine-protein kinase
VALVTQHAGLLTRGAALGRYIVIERLGQGGMGVVYKAYDPELDRRVAVKVLRASSLERAVASEKQARLLREGKVMARLAHPNVVAVYDVGTFDGQVFVAMELVEGETLRAWLKTPRSWREVVAMFAQAGRGLAAAHRAGIVHRDFKPDNVLVGKDGRARVLDFGLANADGDSVHVGAGGESTVSGDSLDVGRSAAGSLVGTPRYMAFEQLVGETTDSSTDQFGFCASLWEALYRQPPFEGDDLLVLIDNIGAGKIKEPAARGVPGSLKATLVRGLSSNAAQRFPSMDALLAELERDPGATRRKWLVASGAALAIGALLLGVRSPMLRRAPACPTAEGQLAGVWDEGVRSALRASFLATGKSFAQDALGGTSKGLDAYAASWVTMRDDTCRATLVRAEQSSELMDLRMACLKGRLTGLRALTSQLSHADASVVLAATQAVDGLPSLEDCEDTAALRAPLHLPAEPALRAQIEAVRSDLSDARALRDTTRPSDAVDLARRLVDRASTSGYRPLQAEALENEGVVLDLAHDTKGAIAALQEAQLAAVAGHHPSIEALAWIDLVHVYGADQRTDPGRAAAKEAHACLDRDGADEGRLAELLLDESIVEDRAGQHSEALELGKHALELRERTLPGDHPGLAACLEQLGSVEYNRANYPEALDYQRQALAIRERAFGPRHPLVATSLGNVANTLSHAARSAEEEGEAVELYRRALEIQTGAFGPEDRTVANTYNNLGNLLNDIGRASKDKSKNLEALELLQRALALRLQLLGPDHPDVGKSYGNIAIALNDLGRSDDAIAYGQRRVDLEERTHGPDYPPIARSLAQIGRAYYESDRKPKAIPYLERAIKLCEASQLSPDVLANARFMLALTLRDTHGDQARAMDLGVKAREEFVREGATHNVDLLDKFFPQGRPR